MKLADHIKELLYRHDLVIIPELGAFIIKPVPASIDRENHTISPPGKTISFNSQIKENDGLLAHYIASKEKIPYENALNFIQFEIQQFKENLKKEDVFWEGIGGFTLEENKIVFTPDPAANFDMEAFGLTRVHATEMNRESGEKTDPALADIGDILDEILEDNDQSTYLEISEEGGSRYGFFKYVAGLALLFGLGYLGYNYYHTHPSLFNNKPVQQAAFEIPGELKPIEIQVNKQDDTATGNEEIQSDVNTDVNNTETAQTGEQNANSVPENHTDKPQIEPDHSTDAVTTVAATETGKYHIIAGAFKIPGNAEKKVRLLQQAGYTGAHIVGVNKWQLTQVAYGSYATKEEAREAIKNIRLTKDGKDAWILVK